jgi:hypothetical protein
MIRSFLRPFDRGGAATRPRVDFVAYAADCRVAGHVLLTESRLSDMLNRHGEFVVQDAVVTSYVGTPDLALPELSLHRDDLFAVVLTGPRGDEEKRRATEAVALGLKLGPYLVRGHIHVSPGADAVAAFRRGRGMVALTDGWISRADGADGAEGRKIRVSALLANRLLAEWVTLSTVDDRDGDAGGGASGSSV